MILYENGQCLLGTKKLEIMLNLGAKFFLSLTNTFSVIVNVNPCQIWTGNTQISFFNFFQQNLVHYQYYKNAPVNTWQIKSGRSGDSGESGDSGKSDDSGESDESVE